MITGLDHIVLAVRDVARTVAFYRDALGFQARQDATGKWSLRAGGQQINLQPADALPSIARNTVPGTANFCVYTNQDITQVIQTLRQHEVEVLAGPDERIGANGTIMSVYFNDPEGNLIEVCNRLDP